MIDAHTASAAAAMTVDTTSRTLDDRSRFSALQVPKPLVLWDVEDLPRVLFRKPKRPVTRHEVQLSSGKTFPVNPV